MDIKDLYKIFSENPVISTDTRNISPGSIFFALKGEHYDGNDFAAEALRKGAAYAVIDRPGFMQGQDQFLPVSDVLSTLQKLAALHRKTTHCNVIAITGSNGKTTTKELIFCVLKQKYHSVATAGNLNNHIGVPLTLLSLEKTTEFAIVEMGANHPGEIGKLCEMAAPGFGLITNIGKAHLEGFGSLEGVIRAKSELYHYIKIHGGAIFINTKNEILRNIGSGINKITYGEDEDNFCQGQAVSGHPYLEIRYRWKNREYTLHTNLTGIYNTENVLAAVCTGLYFNVDPEKINLAIEGYVPSNNRSQVIRTATNVVVLDAYNANPTSMKASIESFLDFQGENKMMILGDMLELGEASEPEHYKLADFVLSTPVSRVILTGHHFENIARKRGIPGFRSTGALCDWLKKNPVENSTILIKGSRKLKLETVVNYL
ncbi:MAG: UDP-N-acetylmuramoyl-tripeptide--D-alanyl-D-alanine ligase [Bacteroidales bacterium]|nr:UDP-N-acetylmuramoyl-tripeptide--D-alanyl-D-alanine ligase [Bacteroidales bacterium]